MADEAPAMNSETMPDLLMNTDLVQAPVATPVQEVQEPKAEAANVNVNVPENVAVAQESEKVVDTTSEATEEKPSEQKAEEPKVEVVIPEVSPAKKITVTVKTPQEKENFEVEENAGVESFKKLMAPKFNAEPEQLCLIFAGKIMNDEDNIQQHNVKEGSMIHLVIRAAPRLMDAGPQRPPADIRATPFQLGSLGGLAGLAQLGMGSANFMEIQNQMQNELLSNPNMLRNLLDNPLVQQLMIHPDTMRTLITRNPQMQELLERYPEINQALENPELLRQTAELARNPSMLQELMRSHQRALGLEPSSPTPITNPLPNMFSSLQEPNLSNMARQFQASATTRPAQGVMNPPPLSSLLQQLSENPSIVQNMLQAPYTQSVLEALAADPNVANAILAENPLITNNPILQNQMRNMMPQFIEQMQNPEIQNLMTNPQALDAIMQIQQGMETLRQSAPNLVHTFAPPTVPSGETPAQGDNPAPPADAFSEFMSRMVAGMAANHDSSLPPEQRYQAELEHLAAMGFNNREVNLQVLIATFGNINATVERLLAQVHLSRMD